MKLLCILGSLPLVTCMAAREPSAREPAPPAARAATALAPPVFRPLFSRSNDAVPALDAAFQRLATGLRPHGCLGCHAPDYEEVTGFATHALYSRHDIVRVLEANAMPPAVGPVGLPGIADRGERQRLIALAKTFAAAGDTAFQRDAAIAFAPAAGDGSR